MVAMAPNVGRPSRHSWRRRLSGAGFAVVKAETPCSNGGYPAKIVKYSRYLTNTIFAQGKIR
jgi:hypothetical protein